MYFAHIAAMAIREIVFPPGLQKYVHWLFVLGVTGAAFTPELRKFIDDKIFEWLGFTPMTPHYVLAAVFLIAAALAVRIALLKTARMRLLSIEAIPGVGYTAIILNFENQSTGKLDDVMVQTRMYRTAGQVTASGRNRFTLITTQEIADRKLSPSREVKRHRFAIDPGDHKGFHLVAIRTSNEFEFPEEVETLKLPGERMTIECKVTHGPAYCIWIVPGDGVIDSDYYVFTYLMPWHCRPHCVQIPCSGLRLELHADRL